MGKPKGRPSDFRPEFCDQTEKLCRLGAIDKQIAEFFDVDERTINRWKQKHPEFCQSLKRGKLLADIEVANSLYKKATGYVIEVEKIIGRGDSRETVKLNVAIEPDTTAQIFWLTNRQKDRWKSKQQLETPPPPRDDGPSERDDQKDYLADLAERYRLPSMDKVKAAKESGDWSALAGHANGKTNGKGNGHDRS